MRNTKKTLLAVKTGVKAGAIIGSNHNRPTDQAANGPMKKNTPYS